MKLIIKALCDLLIGLFDLLLTPVALPHIPDEVLAVLDQAVVYMKAGFSFLANFINLDLVLILFPLAILIEKTDLLYKLVMWVLRKIPMLGIK